MKLALGALLSAISGLALAAPPFPPNAGQTKSVATEIACIAPVTNVYLGFPDLALTLTTNGNPVLVYFSVEVDNPHGGRTIQLRPVIDGTPPDGSNFSVRHNNGDNNGTISNLSMLRVYPLAAGTHTFGVQYSCTAGSIGIRRWLTVYELGGSGLPRDRNNKVSQP